MGAVLGLVLGLTMDSGTTRSTISSETRPNARAGTPTPHPLAHKQREGPQVQPGVLDAAVPGLLTLGVGGFEWLTPDSAATDALAHATHEDIDNALDLHRSLAEHKYHLLSEGSLTNWIGHVGEHQIAEQIESWAGQGTIEFPGASNFAGADLRFFGEEFQAKFYSDFRDIDNVHGDTLIVNEDAASIPSDAYT